MRRIMILTIFLLVYGCAQQTEQLPASYSTYSNGPFTFEYPDWATTELDEAIFLAKTNGTCVFAAAKFPDVPSRLLKKEFEKEGELKSSDGEYLEYVIEENRMNALTRIVYCDYDSYSLTMACPEAVTDKHALESAKCNKGNPETKPKLGIIPFPANDSVDAFIPAFKESRKNGADVLYWYLSWKDAENNWSIFDYLMEPMSYEGRTAVVMEIIHTTVLGKYPARYSSFDDPGFKEDFADFSVDYVKRYQPEYYFIGNEVDIYLHNHRDEIPAYEELLAYVRERINKESPKTKVGVVVTYHAAKENDAFDIVEDLSDDVDILGYTTYGHGDNFSFGNVSKGIEYLNAVEYVVPGKPYAVVEAGWSSSTMLESNEEKQKEYAEAFFEYLETTDAEFVNWFALHDGVDCTEVAKSFFTHMPEVQEDEEFMTIFKEFICSLGIKNSDGTPKKAWSVWQENT